MNFFTSSALSTVELFSLVSLTYLNAIIYTTIGFNSAFLEFCLMILPVYFALCYFDYIYVITLIFAVFTLFFTYFIKKILNEKNLISAIINKRRGLDCFNKNFNKDNKKYLTSASDHVRAIIITLVGICIFLADFSIFNSSKLGKQMYVKKLKLMDIGAGCFTCNAGFVYSICSIKRKMYSVGICLFLGTIRLITVLLKEVDVNEREFGTHLNYFYILALITLILMFKIKYKMLLGLILSVAYEIALKSFLEDLIIENSRSNFFYSNIEGFCFIVPTLSMALIMNSFGESYFLLKKKANQNLLIEEIKSIQMELLRKFLIIILFTFFSMYDGPFRRTHNMHYQMIILTLLLTTGTFFYFFGERIRIFNKIGKTNKKEISNNLSTKNSSLFYVTDKMKLSFLLSRNILFLLLMCSLGIVVNKKFSLNSSDNCFVIHLVNFTYLFTCFYIFPLKILSLRY